MDTYLLADKIVFDSKPDAVPYNYRISYKMAQICLVIAKSCRGRAGCSLVKLLNGTHHFGLSATVVFLINSGYIFYLPTTWHLSHL